MLRSCYWDIDLLALAAGCMLSFNPESVRVQFRQSFAQGAHGVSVYLGPFWDQRDQD